VSIIDFIACTTRNIYATGAGVIITDVIALITRDIHVAGAQEAQEAQEDEGGAAHCSREGR
jgi:hypothetical protein